MLVQGNSSAKVKELQKKITELTQEVQDIEARLIESEESRNELIKNQETLEKMIRDKERIARDDKRNIEHHETDKKLLKGKYKELENLLEMKQNEMVNT